MRDVQRPRADHARMEAELKQRAEELERQKVQLQTSFTEQLQQRQEALRQTLEQQALQEFEKSKAQM